MHYINTNSIIYKSLNPLYKKIFVHKTKEEIKSLASWEKAGSIILSLAKSHEIDGGQIGIYIRSLSSGQTISYNSSKQFSIASIVKLIITAAAYSAAEKYPSAFTQDDITKIDDLAYRMLAKSDNTACTELDLIMQNKFGWNYYDNYCQSLGMLNTTHSRSCALDISVLLEKLYRNELFTGKDTTKKYIDYMKMQIYNNRIPRRLPLELRSDVAHKTGTFTMYQYDHSQVNISCHDVGIVYTPKGDFVISVMIQYIVPCSGTLKPDATKEEIDSFLIETEKTLLQKGSKIIRDISASLYFNCFLSSFPAPEPVL